MRRLEIWIPLFIIQLIINIAILSDYYITHDICQCVINRQQNKNCCCFEVKIKDKIEQMKKAH